MIQKEEKFFTVSFSLCSALETFNTKKQYLKFSIAKVFTSNFVSSNLIKALGSFGVDLQVLLIWWLKPILSLSFIPKSLTFGTTLIFF